MKIKELLNEAGDYKWEDEEEEIGWRVVRGDTLDMINSGGSIVVSKDDMVRMLDSEHEDMEFSIHADSGGLLSDPAYYEFEQDGESYFAPKEAVRKLWPKLLKSK